MKKAVLFFFAAFFLLSSCATKVKRVDADKQIDLSGYWNDIDVRIVCDALVSDCLGSPRVDQAIKTKGSTPFVVVGRFRNESSEHIDTAIISSIMEAAIFNNGKLNFIAPSELRADLRAEIMEQQSNANPATMAKLRNETGANFMMTGSVRSIVDVGRNRQVRTYFVTAELTDIETAQRIWMGQNNEIKKHVRRPRNRL